MYASNTVVGMPLRIPSMPHAIRGSRKPANQELLVVDSFKRPPEVVAVLACFPA